MKLILLGDIAFLGKCSIIDNPKAREYFSEISQRLSTADYVVGNLETPFSIKKKINGAKSAYICTDIQNIDLLKYLKINAVSLANNHIFDYGTEGYELTKKLLSENGISFFGSEGKCLDINVYENKLRFEGFCCFSTNPLQTVKYGEYGVNEYNVKQVERLLSRAVQENRLCITMVHAGLEHINYPSLEHVNAARWLASRHSMLYCGHHPHVAQGIEKQGESLIAYSLGNFCFDDIYTSASHNPLVELSQNNRSSFILEVTIEDNNINSYSIIPIYIGKDKIHVGTGTDTNMIREYTNKINKLSHIEYNDMRLTLLNEYYKDRRKKRNLNWYLKRLNLRYVKLFISNINNSILYKKNIKI